MFKETSYLNTLYPGSPQGQKSSYINFQQDSPLKHEYPRLNADYGVFFKQYEDKLNRNVRAMNYKGSQAANYFPVTERPSEGGYIERQSPKNGKGTSYGTQFQSPETMRPFYERSIQRDLRQANNANSNTNSTYQANSGYGVDVSGKMRNPMYSDFDYARVEPQLTQRRPAMESARNYDSVDQLKFNYESQINSRRDPYPEPVRNLEIAENNAYKVPQQMESARNYNDNKKVSFTPGTNEEKSSPKKYQDTGLKYINESYTEHMKMASPRPQLVPSHSEKTLNRKPNEIYVFNPLTQSPVMRYQKNNKMY